MDAAREVAELAKAGKLDPSRLTEDRFRRFLDEPEIPDVDLFLRSSGEQRTSNFLLWQSAYAEFIFLDRLWPDFDRRDFWDAVEQYVTRETPLRYRLSRSQNRTVERRRRALSTSGEVRPATSKSSSRRTLMTSFSSGLASTGQSQ